VYSCMYEFYFKQINKDLGGDLRGWSRRRRYVAISA